MHPYKLMLAISDLADKLIQYASQSPSCTRCCVGLGYMSVVKKAVHWGGLSHSDGDHSHRLSAKPNQWAMNPSVLVSEKQCLFNALTVQSSL